MPAGDTGIGQPELGVLAAADDVGAFAQLVGAAAAVVELQGDRMSGRRVLALGWGLGVSAVAAAGGLAVVIVPAALLVAALLVAAAVVGLAIFLAAITGARLTVALLLLVATLVGVGGP